MSIHRAMRRLLRPLPVAFVALPLFAALALAPQSAQADAAPVVRDGSSAALAAASCWEIKQLNPSAADGRYWLQTPALVDPQQFWCDQTTDGGGWVLLGRGREGWGFGYNGQGKDDDVSATVTGTGAFTPRALNSKTVDGLLNGGRVDALTDGLRIRRALDTAGTSYMETRVTFTNRDRWVWAFDAGHPLKTWTMSPVPTIFGNRTYSGTNASSANFGQDSSYGRLSTTANKNESYKQGFAYGSGASGSTSSSSYVWKTTTSGARAMPFSQVYLRPRLTAASISYAPIPDSGTAASSIRALPDNLSLPQNWGVSGSGNGSVALFDDEVHSFTQVGGRMIVGGNYKYVQKGAAPAAGDQYEQRFLAAFDVNSAEWLPDFRPTLDGQVLALATLPNGDIVAGGEFTTVNGTAVPGIVALDPTTGQIDPGWQVALEQRISADKLFVRALAVKGSWLYVGGQFSHLSGGTLKTAVYSRNAARVSVANGTPDVSWRPVLNGSVNSISPSADGTRVYLAGWFTTLNGATANRVAVINTATATAVTGLNAPTFSNANATYQQAIREVGDRVWQGGSEHMLFSMRSSDYLRLSGTILNAHGDVQVVSDYDGVVFASCHCEQFAYHDAYNWNSPTGWTQADDIRYVGAWDATTGKYIPEFLPDGIDTRAGHGGWAIQPDSNGTLWVGGDFTAARQQSGTTQWTGGFFRLPQRDHTAPSAPSNVTFGTTPAGDVKVNFTASTDDSGRPVTYEVLAEDRVVALKNGTSFTLPMPTTPTRYFIRALDKSGNRSASSVATLVTPPSP